MNIYDYFNSKDIAEHCREIGKGLEYVNSFGASVLCSGYLTDEGVVIEGGHPLTEGNVVAFARELSRLLLSNALPIKKQM